MDWPDEAKQIIANAGIEDKYRDNFDLDSPIIFMGTNKWFSMDVNSEADPWLYVYNSKLEEDDLELLATVFESMAKHIHKTIHVNGVLECLIKLFLRIALAALLKQRPSHRLGVLHKSAECLNIKGIVLDDTTFGIILKTCPITGIGGSLPTAFRGNQKRFNIRFKLFFIISHGYTSCGSFSVWDESKRCLLSTTA